MSKIKKNAPSLLSYRGKVRLIFLSCLLPICLLFAAILWLEEESGMKLYSLISLILGALILSVFYFNFRNPLIELKLGLEELSKDSFTIRIPVPHDERAPLAKAFNELAQSLEDFGSGESHIREEQNRILSSFKENSKLLEDQEDKENLTIRHVSSHLRAIQSGVQTFEEELVSASHTAASTRVLATSGEEGLLEMETIMQKMLTSSANIVTTLSTLQDEVGTINQVILAIVKIADQSNLLSLNTAIRANKSGFQGKGFAVIADRIREMADQIALATLDIEKSVQDIIKTVLEASGEVNSFSDKIRHQDLETGEIAKELKQLIGNTQEQLQLFERIKDEIVRQLQQVSLVTQLIGRIKKETNVSHTLAHKLQREIDALQSGRHLGGMN